MELEQQLAAVARLHARGHTQAEIAEMLPTRVSQKTVCEYVAKVRARYRELSIAAYGEAVQAKLAEYREVRSQAWLEWERSRKDAESTEEEQALRAVMGKAGPDGKAAVTGAKLQVVRQLKTITGRLGASEYLKVVLMCLEREADLEGLSVQFNPQNKRGQSTTESQEFPWDRLFGRPPSSDPVAGKIEDILQQQVAALPPVTGSYEVKPTTNGEANGRS